nr:Rep [Kummerowia striata CRESS virus]
MPSGALHYCFTLKVEGNNEPANWLVHCDFLIYQKERGDGDTNYIHWQGYFKLKQKHTLPWLKQNVHPSAHFEVKRGTVQQAIAYCTKEDTRLEAPIQHGVPPVEIGHRTDLETMAQAVKDGAPMEVVADISPPTWIRNWRGLQEYRNLVRPQPTEKPIVHVLWGPPGTGKSHYGKQLGTYKLITLIDKTLPWFDGHYDEEVIIVDEFKGQWDINFLKNFLFERKCMLPVKGGFIKNRAKHIVLTSNYDICDWYPNLAPVDKLAILRRIDFYFNVVSEPYDFENAVFVNMRAPIAP